ncbi:MAG: protein kinase domain-containing protein [Acidobacteriota bacterium]
MAVPPDLEQRIEALLESALNLDPAERTSFLDRACAGNSSLRQKVEFRLAARAKVPRPGDAPSARQSKPYPDPGVVVGEMISHYKILSFLGRGGMGEVYLAQDTRLGRKVALKLLPKALSSDEERLRRFEREARSASALSHPNVCVIHEIGETENGRAYISMEYIDGETLRRRLGRAPLKLHEAIDIAQQTASALASAHDAGVVHRDIKPENIMLRRDSYVKVLDFGLAKLTERFVAGSDSEAPTFHIFSTHSGVLLGTTNYLSPEQARRLDVDERADIWGLGVVLYEMVTSRLPFNGETPSHVIVSILESDPSPLTQFLPSAPAELEWIVKKALRKNREQRYQSIKELLGDLEEVKQRISESRTEHARQIASSIEMPPVTRHSSAFESISQSLRKPRISIGVFVLALVLLGLASWGAFHWLRKPATPFHNMQVTKLTNTGRSIQNGAIISPDGRYLAYVVDDDGRQSLVVSYQATASNVVVVPPAEGRYHGLTFSNDGNYIYYVRRDRSDPRLLYQVPVLGGFSRKIMSNVTSPITFSPDGREFAFVRFDEIKGEYSLIIAQADGTAEKVLARRNNTDVFSINGLDWSPDGKMIAVPAGRYATGFHMRAIGVNVADGTEKTISSRQWFSILQVKWLKNGSGLILNAADESVSPVQIWYLSYPAGETTKITNDSSDYYGISLSANTANLVTVQSNRLKSIWVSPSADPDQAVEITSGVGLSYGLSWTPDGRIIYSTMASGKLDLWRLESDGTDKTQLTANAGANYHPAVSPDGRYIFFSSNRTGTFNIWRMDADGNNPKQLSNGGSDFYPYPSPDAQWIVYQSGGAENARPTLWKISVDGNQPMQITNVNTSVPVISPDGRLIACRYWDEKSGAQKIAIVPFSGGPPIKILNIPIVDWQRVRWTSDGASLTYIDTRAGVPNLWRQPLDGNPAKQLTTFKSDQIFSYDWSRDGKLLACERGLETSDVVLIRSAQ